MILALARLLALPALLCLSCCRFVVVGSYTLVKGEISEKLAVRLADLGSARTTRNRTKLATRFHAGSMTRVGIFLPRKRVSESRFMALPTPSAASSASGGKSFAGSLRS